MTMLVTQDKNGQTYITETNYFGMFVFASKRLKWSQEEIKKQAKSYLKIYDDFDIEELDENSKNFIKNMNKIIRKEG